MLHSVSVSYSSGGVVRISSRTSAQLQLQRQAISWLEENLENGSYKVFCREDAGIFYISLIIFENLEDLNLFMLTTKLTCKIVDKTINT